MKLTQLKHVAIVCTCVSLTKVKSETYAHTCQDVNELREPKQEMSGVTPMKD